MQATARTFAAYLIAFSTAIAPIVLFAEEAGNDAAALAAALKGINVSLSQGLAASASQGKPISGKWEIDGGQLQLSVYTSKGGEFFEVIVDHGNGKVAKTEKITNAEDLAAAQAQSQAMASTKRSLAIAVDKAVKSNRGFRAIRVVPTAKDGKTVAEVTLLKGETTKSVIERL